MQHGTQANKKKMLLLTMTGTFTLVVEPEWIYSLLERPHTHEWKKKKPDYKATQWQALILVVLSLFPISCVFSLLNLTTLIGIILFGREQESNYVVLSWKWKFILNIAGLLIWLKKKKTVSCVFPSSISDLSIHFIAFSDVLNTRRKQCCDVFLNISVRRVAL